MNPPTTNEKAITTISIKNSLLREYVKNFSWWFSILLLILFKTDSKLVDRSYTLCSTTSFIGIYSSTVFIVFPSQSSHVPFDVFLNSKIFPNFTA